MAELVYVLHIREDLKVKVTRTQMIGFKCDFAVISIEYEGRYRTCYAITVDDYEVISKDLLKVLDSLDTASVGDLTLEKTLEHFVIASMSWEELK